MSDLVGGGAARPIFGDELGLGTTVEDAVSVVAACNLTQSTTMREALRAIGTAQEFL